MTRNVTARLAISDIGDQIQTNPFYGQAGQDEPFSSSWDAQKDVVRGDLVIDQGELFIPVSSPTRRHLFAVSAVSGGGLQVQLSFHGQGNFGWEGGLPAEPIDVDDYNFIASAYSVQPITVGKLYVSTSPQTEQKIYLAVPATGASGTFLFVEGEEEERFRVWNP